MVGTDILTKPEGGRSPCYEGPERPRETEADQYGYKAYADHDNFYAPFLSEIDWQVAKWAKLRGPSSTALTELFKIPQVCLFVLNSSKLYNLLQFI